MLRTIQLYEQLSLFEKSEDFRAELNTLYGKLQGIRQNLDLWIDHLVGKLSRQLTSDKLPSKQGFFTGIHKWWKNLFGGHNNKDNPYYLQNKIGALGRTDIDPATLGEFRIINALAEYLVEATAAPQTVVVRILAGFKTELRKVMQQHIDLMIQRVGEIIKVTKRDGVPESPTEAVPTNNGQAPATQAKSSSSTAPIKNSPAPAGSKPASGTPAPTANGKPASAGKQGTGGKVHGIGDIHGEYDEMMLNLEHQGLTDKSGNWSGGDAILACTGDLIDRGPHGIKVINKFIDLQEQAKQAGGEVIVTIGNHDILAFALARALRGLVSGKLLKELQPHQAEMADESKALQILKAATDKLKTEHPGKETDLNNFYGLVEHQISNNGMAGHELVELATDTRALKWGLELPAMVKRRGILFQHTNGHGTYESLLHTSGAVSHKDDSWQFDHDDEYDKAKHGDPIEKVNAKVRHIMQHGSAPHVEALFNQFTSSKPSRTWDHSKFRKDSTKKDVDQHLRVFGDGVHMIAHGHSQHTETTPVIYDDNRVVNLDTGITYGHQPKGTKGRMYDFSPHAVADKPTSNPADPTDLDAEAEKLGITADTPITMVKGEKPQKFGKLDAKMKKSIIDMCKSSSKDCPANQPAAPESKILANKAKVKSILMKHISISVENVKKFDNGEPLDPKAQAAIEKLDPETIQIMLTVHNPWLKLSNHERKAWNQAGGTIRSREKGKYPFIMPVILRKKDPRIGILKEYYDDLYNKLLRTAAGQPFRIELDTDTEDTVQARIESLKNKSRKVKAKRTKKIKPTRGSVDVPDESKTTATGPELGQELGQVDDGREDTSEVYTAHLPRDIEDAVLSLAEEDEQTARAVADAWGRIKDKQIHRKFKALIDEKNYQEAIGLADNDKDDDDILSRLKDGYQPSGRPLVEVLKERLRLQREGKAAPWKRLPHASR